MTVKVYSSNIDVYINDSLELQASDAQFAAGHIALYGENDVSAQFDDVYVRQYAASEPTSFLGAEEGQNTAPVTVDDAYITTIDTALEVIAPGVLANDTDADSDPLTAVKSNGS